MLKISLELFGGRGGGSQTYAQGSASIEHKQAIIDAFKHATGADHAA